MKNNRLIFLLGAIFFAIALLKYVFIPDALPTMFVVFEVLSFLVILYLIYYISHYIENCVQGKDEAHMSRECILRQAEISKLKGRLEKYENSEMSDVESVSKRQTQLIDAIKTYLSGMHDDAGVKIINLLKTNYEVMAAIAYNYSGETYLPAGSFGLDEDEEIQPVGFEDGIHSQAITDNKAIEIADVPADYLKVGSGSGSAKPAYLYLLPAKNENNKGLLIEVASFKRLDILEVWNKASLTN